MIKCYDLKVLQNGKKQKKGHEENPSPELITSLIKTK